LTDKNLPLLERILNYANPVADPTAHPLHSLHPYAAKYIPSLPREVIREHTNGRNCILDPFAGSGTTLLEAALLGRRSVGIDSNPLACLISEAKTRPISEQGLQSLQSLLCEVRAAVGDPSLVGDSGFRPDLPRLEHWFQPNMLRELAWLREECLKVKEADARRFSLCILSSVINAASNQDSETRYKAVAKQLSGGFAIKKFVRRLNQLVPAAADLSKRLRNPRYVPVVFNISAEGLLQEMAPRSIDLVVTSPPYPNSYDYYLYHRLRMAWLDLDHVSARSLEIGSRYEHSSQRASLERFTERMEPVMDAIASVLKPGKLAYFFVGDAVLAGEHVDMGEVYIDLAKRVGLGYVSQAEYDLSRVSRSFKDTRLAAGNGHGYSKQQRVVVLEGRTRTGGSTGRVSAKPKPRRQPQRLVDAPSDGQVIALDASDGDRHVHSLFSFPSKFIPQIPAWAISEWSRGGLVVDPFAGSGTTAVEALLQGIDAVSIDVSPFACLLARAKTTIADPSAIRDAAAIVEAAANTTKRSPRVSGLRFPLDDFWFNHSHLDEFAGLRSLIESEVPVDLRPFFLAVLASTIRQFSYQDESQVKVKRDGRKVLGGTPSPGACLLRKMPGAVTRLVDFNERLSRSPRHQVVCGTAEAAVSGLELGTADLVVTSPPYINAMNYAMTFRYELVLLGLLPHEGLVEHDRAYFGTERVYATDYSVPHKLPSDWSMAEDINAGLEQIFEEEPKRSYIAYEYFVKMQEAFERLVDSLSGGAVVVLVAGHNTIRGVRINTFEFLCSLLEDLGAQRERTFYYELIKQRFKLTRHETAGLIRHDGVGVFTVG
jgi:DNA modification methylase